MVEYRCVIEVELKQKQKEGIIRKGEKIVIHKVKSTGLNNKSIVEISVEMAFHKIEIPIDIFNIAFEKMDYSN